MLKELFKYAAIAGILAYLMLKIVLPLVKTMLEPPPQARQKLGSNVDIVDEEGAPAEQKAVNSFEQRITQARDMAQQDPKVVANIIKDWTGANAS